MNILAVALGGTFGTLLRYLIILLTTKIIGALSFWAILIINLTGCFVMGMVSLLVMPRTEWPEPIRLGIATGVLGGFTTFSSFSFDAGRLINDGAYGLAAFYIGTSVAGGIALFFLGQHIARQL